MTTSPFNGPVRIELQLSRYIITPSEYLPCHISSDGRTVRLDGAFIQDGSIIHLQDDLLHRDEGPAIIRPDGYMAWYLNGRLHRADGPAVISPGGTRYWYINGICQRSDRPGINRTLLYLDGFLRRSRPPWGG
jgi:hypothetical protein